jgi:hypothetical protein
VAVRWLPERGTFFDLDRSKLPVEREKLADQIVSALAAELVKALQT